MAFANSWFWWTPVLVSSVPVVVVTVLAYLVLRFGIRDGLRAHTRWLERRAAATASVHDGGTGEQPSDAR